MRTWRPGKSIYQDNPLGNGGVEEWELYKHGLHYTVFDIDGHLDVDIAMPLPSHWVTT